MSYFRRNIQAMAGYTPGEQPGPGDRVVKLNTNENPYPPSPRVAEALRSFDPAILRKYPDPMTNRVRDRLAEIFGLKRENFLCGNGSDELLSYVFRAFCGEGDRIAWPTPTYSLYPVLAAIQGAMAVEVPTGEDFSVAMDDLSGLDARAVILCNPNAPTGVLTPVDEIRRLAGRFAGVVVVDEAYVDFAADNAMRLAASMPNVLVLRTLSKSYSLAGLRFGYAAGSAELIEGLAKVKDSYNVDALAAQLALAAIEDADWMRASVEKVRAERVRLSAALEALGLVVTPSEANFVLARVPGPDARPWYEGLKRRGVLVRYWNLPRLADKLRITVGTPQEDDALLAALAQVKQEVQG